MHSRVKFCAECLKNLFPVLVESETASRREPNHVSRVKLPIYISDVEIRCMNHTYTSSGAKAWQPGDSVMRML
jgi:hypothetical protein